MLANATLIAGPSRPNVFPELRAAERTIKNAPSWRHVISSLAPLGRLVLVERKARDEFEYSVATSPPTRRQRQLAFVVVVVTLAAYGAVAPFSGLPLQRYDSFVPAMAALMFVTDLVTAVLLFGQFSATGSRGLLVLASGYLFSSLIAIPFALTFPGAFAPTGLLGAGLSERRLAQSFDSHRFDRGDRWVCPPDIGQAHARFDRAIAASLRFSGVWRSSSLQCVR